MNLPSSTPPKPIPTPCIKVCIVDGESGLCLGCFRTLNEIAAWATLPGETRDQLMSELPHRKDRIDPRKLGLA